MPLIVFQNLSYDICGGEGKNIFPFASIQSKSLTIFEKKFSSNCVYIARCRLNIRKKSNVSLEKYNCQKSQTTIKLYQSGKELEKECQFLKRVVLELQ